MPNERRRLPSRRANETFAFTCNGLKYLATVARYEDGQLAEIFIGNAKAGSHSDSAAKDSAVVCSIALQYGTPADVIRRALLRDPQGVRLVALGRGARSHRGVRTMTPAGAGMLGEALTFAAEGLQVFPLIPRTKDPATKRGFYDATTNPATIRRYWRAADRNIGIRTGAASGFWILDVDPGGEEPIHRLEAEHGALPPTRTVRTGRGGRHLWFRYVGPIDCSIGRVASYVDVRGDGGYAVAPSSVHENGRTYEWATDPRHELAIAPDWLVHLTRRKASISERARVQTPPCAFHPSAAYGAVALNAEITALAAAQPGTRNDTLNRAAFALFQLVAGGELDGGTVESRLIRACEINGLIADDGPRSVTATIASAKRAGTQFPRSRFGRPA